jgi:DNA-binding transcriptional LysR family regulator
LAVIYDRPNVYSPVARQLAVLGIEPRIEVTVESFLAMPSFVSGTDRVALIQERLARQIAPETPVRTLECPFEIAPITEALWFHPTQLHDAGHTWMRRVLQRAAADFRMRSEPPVRG